MSTNPSLTATQEPVLALIAAGFTTAAAAEKAGVHRNTVTNWLHQNDFRSALERARSDKALLYQDQAEALAAEALAAEALAALRAIIADPAVPPAVRVKAAIAMLDRAASLPPLAAVPDVQPSLPALECCQKNAQPSPPSSRQPRRPAPFWTPKSDATSPVPVAAASNSSVVASQEPEFTPPPHLRHEICRQTTHPMRAVYT